MTQVMMRDIIAAVADRRGFKAEDLRGPSRKRPIAHARHEAMYLCRLEGRWTFPQIGRVFARDHATVIHGIRAHEARAGQ